MYGSWHDPNRDHFRNRLNSGVGQFDFDPDLDFDFDLDLDDNDRISNLWAHRDMRPLRPDDA
jgi:hypothetical protein